MSESSSSCASGVAEDAWGVSDLTLGSALMEVEWPLVRGSVAEEGGRAAEDVVAWSKRSIIRACTATCEMYPSASCPKYAPRSKRGMKVKVLQGELTFLSLISSFSSACKPLRICFAEMVVRSLLARMSSIIALYCAVSAGVTDGERISSFSFAVQYHFQRYIGKKNLQVIL